MRTECCRPRPSRALQAKLGRAAYSLNLMVGSKRIALHSVEGLKVLGTDGSSHKKLTALATTVYWKHKEGGTRVFFAGVQPIVRETAEELCRRAVHFFEVLWQSAQQAIQLEYLARTGALLPPDVLSALAANASERGVIGTISDHAANETKFSQCLSEAFQQSLMRLGCGMHMVDNAVKLTLDAEKVRENIAAQCAEIAARYHVSEDSLFPPHLPTQLESAAGRVGAFGAKKAAELLTSSMGSTVDDRRAIFKLPFRLHQTQMQKAEQVSSIICSVRSTRCMLRHAGVVRCVYLLDLSVRKNRAGPPLPLQAQGRSYNANHLSKGLVGCTRAVDHSKGVHEVAAAFHDRRGLPDFFEDFVKRGEELNNVGQNLQRCCQDAPLFVEHMVMFALRILFADPMLKVTSTGTFQDTAVAARLVEKAAAGVVDNEAALEEAVRDGVVEPKFNFLGKFGALPRWRGAAAQPAADLAQAAARAGLRRPPDAAAHSSRNGGTDDVPPDSDAEEETVELEGEAVVVALGHEVQACAARARGEHAAQPNPDPAEFDVRARDEAVQAARAALGAEDSVPAGAEGVVGPGQRTHLENTCAAGLDKDNCNAQVRTLQAAIARLVRPPAADQPDDAPPFPDHPIWEARAMYRELFFAWLNASLKLLLQKFREFATDVLPDGRGRLNFLLGEGAPPADIADLLRYDMDLPADNTPCESLFSLWKRRCREAPNGASGSLTGPKLLQLNGGIVELRADPQVAQALVDAAFQVRSVVSQERACGYASVSNSYGLCNAGGSRSGGIQADSHGRGGRGERENRGAGEGGRSRCSRAKAAACSKQAGSDRRRRAGADRGKS